MGDLIINGKVFKPYDDMYYISCDGDVYSKYSKKILKAGKDLNGYLRVDIHQKHVKIHTLVYRVWVGPIEKGKQINHYDDNKYNNHYSNLYIGTQKENIADCFRNDHRVGHISYLTVYDKETGNMKTFCPAITFSDYCGHTSANGSVSKFFNKNWFKKRYEIVDFSPVCNRMELEGVTTMADECRSVGQILSLPEARCNLQM